MVLPAEVSRFSSAWSVSCAWCSALGCVASTGSADSPSTTSSGPVGYRRLRGSGPTVGRRAQTRNRAELPAPPASLSRAQAGACRRQRVGGRRSRNAPRWDLSLNTGESQRDHVGLDPAAEPRHWFVVDLALAHQCGLTLFGPAPQELIGAPDPADVREAQRDVVVWYASRGQEVEAAPAACRAWHWRDTGPFAPKRRATNGLHSRSIGDRRRPTDRCRRWDRN